MFAKSYINNVILPRVASNPAPPQISVTLNGSDEYVDVYNEQMVNLLNNETVTCEAGAYTNPFTTSSEQVGI